jgi:hypothetical protein
LAYCTNKYGDSQYNSYWPALSKERLGIDLYKAATVNTAKAEVLIETLLERVCISSGTVQRWLDDFEEWYATIKGSVFTQFEREDLYN